MDLLKYQILAFIYCSLFGSFLNVVIYRLPRGEDLVMSRSRCPQCSKKIHWYELLPIFSYLFLRGKCSGCKNRISLRYPITEFLVAVMGIYLLPAHFDQTSLVLYVFYFVTFCLFMAHFQIDLDHKILPDSLNLILLAMFLGYSIPHFSWTHWVIGGAIGFLFPLAITWLFYLWRGQVGLGGGDIKLFGILGIYMGPEWVVKNIFLSCFLGALVGGAMMATNKLKRNEALAFGPFILIVAFIQIFFPALFDLFNQFIL